jgi:hypothetical protein
MRATGSASAPARASRARYAAPAAAQIPVSIKAAPLAVTAPARVMVAASAFCRSAVHAPPASTAKTPWRAAIARGAGVATAARSSAGQSSPDKPPRGITSPDRATNAPAGSRAGNAAARASRCSTRLGGGSSGSASSGTGTNALPATDAQGSRRESPPAWITRERIPAAAGPNCPPSTRSTWSVAPPDPMRRPWGSSTTRARVAAGSRPRRASAASSCRYSAAWAGLLAVSTTTSQPAARSGAATERWSRRQPATRGARGSAGMGAVVEWIRVRQWTPQTALGAFIVPT